MKVIFVVGTTACGKSQWALDQAAKSNGAIVNCDSIQVYQGLKIGSALPSSDEMKKVPHFLFDFVPEGETISAGDYARNFFSTVEKIKNEFSEIYVVGGTGFYFQAIEKGMYEEGPADQKIKAQVEEEIKINPSMLYQEMVSKDPSLKGKIFPNDHYRVGRAVELMRVHNKTLQEIKAMFAKQTNAFPYALEKKGIALTKEELLPRVLERTQKMLKAGLVEEVKALLLRNSEEWKPLSSVGYFEVRQLLRGEIKSEELAPLIVQNTMRLAKKQRTWFKRDLEIQWFKP